MDAYVEYAKILFKEFGAQVKYWVTHNEPRVVSTRGYGSDGMAPGINDPHLVPLVNHHLFLSHGLAVKAYRELNLPGQIGISLNLKPVYCLEGDLTIAKMADREKNRNYLDPILLGTYPQSADTSFIHTGDLETISQPIDFLGVNNYSREVISAKKHVPQSTNCLGWEIFPQGIHDLLVNLKVNYSNLPPIIITENGYADEEECLDGKVCDHTRIEYINAHIRAVKQAQNEGVAVIGYLAWSLMDNLEWSFGTKPRFGLIHVNFDTLKRTPKDSFYTYKQIIALQKDLNNLKKNKININNNKGLILMKIETKIEYGSDAWIQKEIYEAKVIGTVGALAVPLGYIVGTVGENLACTHPWISPFVRTIGAVVGCGGAILAVGSTVQYVNVKVFYPVASETLKGIGSALVDTSAKVVFAVAIEVMEHAISNKEKGVSSKLPATAHSISTKRP